MVFRVGLPILNVDLRKPRDEEFKLLFREYRNELFRYDFVEACNAS